MKTTSRAKLAASLLAAVMGCGLSVGGGASIEPADGGPSSGDDGPGPSGSSGGSTSGGSGGSRFDQDDTVDGLADDGTEGDGSPGPDSAVGDATVPFPEAGPFHGAMGCPPGSDAGLCDLSSNVCCTCPGCFAPYPTTCFPALTGCVGVVFSGIYARLTCGDVTNCQAGSVCCAEFNSTPALTGSSCLAACSATGAVQLCSTSTECPPGKTCQALASIPGFSGCQ